MIRFASVALTQSSAIPQVFVHLEANGKIDTVVFKILDDILTTGAEGGIKSFAVDFGRQFILGETTNGPFVFWFLVWILFDTKNFRSQFIEIKYRKKFNNIYYFA